MGRVRNRAGSVHSAIPGTGAFSQGRVPCLPARGDAPNMPRSFDDPEACVHVLRCCARSAPGDETMKADIHPKYAKLTATCSCGNVIETGSTLGHDIHIDVCSKCHPFYSGKQKV